MRSTRTSLLMAVALAALGPLAGAAQVYLEPGRINAPRPSRTANPGGPRRGPGWTVAHVKRVAKKARNQRRHKAAVRRAS